MNSNQSLQLMISQPKKKKTPLKNLQKKKEYLEEVRLEVEEKNETEAQSCLDRIW